MGEALGAEELQEQGGPPNYLQGKGRGQEESQMEGKCAFQQTKVKRTQEVDRYIVGTAKRERNRWSKTQQGHIGTTKGLVIWKG